MNKSESEKQAIGCAVFCWAMQMDAWAGTKGRRRRWRPCGGSKKNKMKKQKPTRRLEVETPQLDRIGGMVELHLFAVGKAAFPGLGLGPFSTQQGTSCN